MTPASPTHTLPPEDDLGFSTEASQPAVELSLLLLIFNYLQALEFNLSCSMTAIGVVDSPMSQVYMKFLVLGNN